MLKKNPFAVLIIFGLFFSVNMGCKKNEYTNQINDNGKVYIILRGRVVDEKGNPVNAAFVKAGSNAVTSDINGYFSFSHVGVNVEDATVSIEKGGYFKVTRTFSPIANEDNYVEFQLIPQTFITSFLSITGGAATLQTSVTVQLPSNGFVNKNDNSVYTGKVNVYGAYLDPTASNITQVMPGNLMGISASNNRQLLQSYGMMAVELEGANGEKLQLKSGSTAIMKMDIPASLQSNSPTTIPLWFFDELSGLWKEEGTAIKQGNAYVGSISHFSFWNCDVPNSFVKLSFTLKDSNGKSLPNAKVKLTNLINGISTYGFTNNYGFVSGAVPINTELLLQVIDNCENAFYSKNIGSFSIATNLGVVNTSTSQIKNLTISGTIANCSGGALTTGFVELIIDGKEYYQTVNNGTYSFSISRCNLNATVANIIAVNTSLSQQGNTSLTVSTGTYPSVNLQTCGNYTNEFVSFVINGSDYYFLNNKTDSFNLSYSSSQGLVPQLSNSTIGTYIYSLRYNNPYALYPKVAFLFNGMSVGSFPLSNLFLQTSSSRYYSSPNTISNVVINTYDSIGGYIQGNYSGVAVDSSTSVITPVSMSFKVKRRN